MPTTIDILTQVIEDIKKIISRAPYRETVGEPTIVQMLRWSPSYVTLMKIYDVIEEAEKQIDIMTYSQDGHLT